MKTFVTIKSNGSNGPKIKAEDLNEAKKILKLMHPNHDNVKYTIIGEEIIIPKGKISDVCLGKRNKTGGFKWKYKYEMDKK